MTAIATVRSLIIAQIPEANDLLIDRTLIEVAREFCNYTRAWRTTVAETVTADTLEVALTPPTDGELVDIVKATLDGAPMDKKTMEQLDEVAPKWRTDPKSGNYITLSDTQDEVLVAPISSTTYTSGLSVRAAWRPVLAAATLDTMLISRYSDALVHGTLGRLLSIPGETWQDGPLASYYTVLYQDDMIKARQASADGNMKGIVRKVRYGGL